MSLLIWQSLRRTVFWHIGLRRRERHQLDPLVPLHRSIVLCKMYHLHPLRKHLSKGVGLSGPHSSKAICDLLSHSKLAQGQMLHSQYVQVTEIVASNVEVQLTSLESARSPGVKTRAKVLIRTTRTREKDRLFRSGKGVSTSPPLQSFQKGHQ